MTSFVHFVGTCIPSFNFNITFSTEQPDWFVQSCIMLNRHDDCTKLMKALDKMLSLGIIYYFLCKIMVHKWMHTSTATQDSVITFSILNIFIIHKYCDEPSTEIHHQSALNCTSLSVAKHICYSTRRCAPVYMEIHKYKISDDKCTFIINLNLLSKHKAISQIFIICSTII